MSGYFKIPRCEHLDTHESDVHLKLTICYAIQTITRIYCQWSKWTFFFVGTLLSGLKIILRIILQFLDQIMQKYGSVIV